ncbi:hypothetical protein [Halobacteriovorax sp. HLS]|uniref:hypothetical protein n=1 Tax=Halobacteriovorax sp. HLS TaxID=2234000 RepID=UPI000FD6D10F|nr:hypothetical protein [Halobacteriovorax sp. HLS]
MNKLVTLTFISMLFASCATKTEIAANSHALAQREIASSQSPSCVLESHPRNKSWYRLSVNGKAYGKHWYSKKDASKMKERFMHKGQCQ